MRRKLDLAAAMAAPQDQPPV
jgi:integrase